MKNKIYARTYLLLKLRKYTNGDLIQGLRNVIETQGDDLEFYDDVCEFAFKNFVDRSRVLLEDYKIVIMNKEYDYSDIVIDCEEYIIFEFKNANDDIVRYRLDKDSMEISVDEELFADVLIMWAQDSLEEIFRIKK